MSYLNNTWVKPDSIMGSYKIGLGVKHLITGFFWQIGDIVKKQTKE